MKNGSGLLKECLAELAGVFILVFFGVGAVQAAVLTGAQSGLWQVAVVWGLAVALALYAVGGVSGGHINPAMTLAFALYRRFPGRRVAPYVAAQLAGALLAAATLHALFGHALVVFERTHGITRGAPGSELSAMVFGEYFPNPATARDRQWPHATVTSRQAMLAEGLGTALLAFVVFALTHPRNAGSPTAALTPALIGLTVAALISVIAPLTQAGLNPARDFGPRLYAYWAGWGRVAIPGPRGGFLTVYVLAPILGALIGAGCHEAFARLKSRDRGSA
jgi:glycerol uptake facilitator protein